MIRRPPRSTLFPTRRSSDLLSLETCVNGRKVYGGPAPEAVKVQIENIKHFIQERA